MSGKSNIVFKSLSTLGSAAKGAASEGSASGKRGMFLAGEHVLGVANTRVPHESGDLQRSGAVSQDDSTGATAVSYDTDYAVRQHEDESLSHDAGRESKFLENSMISERETALAIVAQAVKKGMGL